MSNKYMSFNAWVKQRRRYNHRLRNKIAYRTREVAHDALVEIDDDSLTAYQCPVCDLWHLTHGEVDWPERYRRYRERAS